MSEVNTGLESTERLVEEGAGEEYGGLRAQTPGGSRATPEVSRGEDKTLDRSYSKGQAAQPLRPDQALHAAARSIIKRAENNWLRNTDVVELLSKWHEFGLAVSREPPNKPKGGTLFLFDKKRERYFRRDGHHWRKKPNGKTVRETHEKLKVDNKDVLNCYYTHSEESDSLQRRCYWLLENDEGIVLVHYLNAGATRNRNGLAPVQSKAGLAPVSSKGAAAASIAPASVFQSPIKEAQLEPYMVAENIPRGERTSSVERGNLTAQRDMMIAQNSAARDSLARLQDLRSKQSAQSMAPFSAFAPPSFLAPQGFQLANVPLFRAIDTAQAADRGVEGQLGREGQDPLRAQRIAVEGIHSQNPEMPETWTQEPSADTASGSRSRVSQSGAEPDQSGDPEGQPEGEKRRKRRRRSKPIEEQPREWAQVGAMDPTQVYLRTCKDLADYFQQSTLALIHHLQELRKADQRSWQELLNLERERVTAERDSFTAIAAAIVGHLTGLSSQAPATQPGVVPPDASGDPSGSGQFQYRPPGGFAPNTGPRPAGRPDQQWDPNTASRDANRR